MKKTVLDFVCKLQGFRTSLQNIHWNADNMSQHKLCDDIMDRISSFEDQVAEVEQSISGNLPLNKLKGTEYKATGLKKFVEDVIDETNKFYQKVKGFGEKYVGMASDCESFISDMQRNSYLVNFTIKEDFKRSYRRRINEGKTDKLKVRLSEDEFKNLLGEAVRTVMSKNTINESCDEAEVKGGEYNDKELDFTHFAVNKQTNLIVDGWGYAGYDTEDLASNKRDYFYQDLEDNGFNPKAYKILSFKACKRAGIDPNNKQNWSNTGVFPLFEEIHMRQNEEDPFAIARERHPDWFID